MKPILETIFWLWLFYISFIFTMGVYRAHLTGRLSLFNLIITSPVWIFALLADVICNWTFASVWFLEKPDQKTFWQKPDLVTDRLKRYLLLAGLNGPDEWRVFWARLICYQELDPFDPNPKGHCQ